ncbi:MAG: helix-hairpin-helix domain-containing protein [Chitinophagales bacterium]
MKKIIKEYLTFSKRERNGVLVLLALIMITLILPYTFPYLIHSEPMDSSEFLADVERFRTAAVAQTSQKGYGKKKWEQEDEKGFSDKEYIIEEFDFNPNKLTYEQGRKLGLNHKIAQRITKYLKAGGKFKKKEDLKKIYDFSDEDYKRLAPFAIFEEEKKGYQKNKKSGKGFEDKKEKDWASKKSSKDSYPTFEVKLAPFDPNKLTYEDGRQLGLSHQASKALVGFVKKGMVFRKKEDIKKVYGFTDEDYERLEDLIQIEEKKEDIAANEDFNLEEKRERPKTFQKFEEKEPISVDINTATIEDWKKLKGIGSSFSNRIVKYRDMLGGFTHPEQLKEVYGLDAILYVEIMNFLTNENPQEIKSLNINTVDELTLKGHPYISPKLAKAIVKKRIRRGDYQEVSEIQKIAGVDDVLFQKLSPYLSVR